MYGRTMGTLNVYVVSATATSSASLGQAVWTLSGDQGRNWHRAQVKLPPGSAGKRVRAVDCRIMFLRFFSQR